MELAIAADWDGDLDVYTVRADGSNLTQFTDNPGADVGPAWSKDGLQLAFATDALTNPRVYISPVDGSPGRIIAPDLELTTLHFEWSPDGDRIAFRNLEDLYVVNTLTSEKTLLTPGRDINPSNPHFSPSGTMLVFKADLASGEDGLFVVNGDGTGLTELTSVANSVHQPSWHPTQDKILFELSTPAEGVGLFVVSLDGSVEKLPIIPVYRASSASWSPDGSMIGYIVRESVLLDSSGGRLEFLERNSLHVATADGSVDLVMLEPPEDPTIGLQLHELTWAPDGRHLAYTAVTEGGTVLSTLDICGGTTSLVVEGIDFYSTPSWRPLP